MSYKLITLPKILIDVGLVCHVDKGSDTSGHGNFGTVKGVLCHHTAGPLPCAANDGPSLVVVEKGRAGLAGPLCNLYLSPEGEYTFVAAGTAWHAGVGNHPGVTNGNTDLIGIEAENTGLSNDPWPQVQYEAYAKGCAALLDAFNLPTEMCIGHKEWTKRKIDPSFDMNTFRKRVATYRSANQHTDVKLSA